MNEAYSKPLDRKPSTYTYTKKEMNDYLERQHYNPFEDKQKREPTKQTFLSPKNMEIYLQNFMALSEAITKAGGNAFIVLKDNDHFLQILANNHILLEKVTYTKNE